MAMKWVGMVAVVTVFYDRESTQSSRAFPLKQKIAHYVLDRDQEWPMSHQ